MTYDSKNFQSAKFILTKYVFSFVNSRRTQRTFIRKKSCKNAWERRNSKFQISFSLSFVVDLKSHALFPYMKDLFDLTLFSTKNNWMKTIKTNPKKIKFDYKFRLIYPSSSLRFHVLLPSLSIRVCVCLLLFILFVKSWKIVECFHVIVVKLLTPNPFSILYNKKNRSFFWCSFFK